MATMKIEQVQSLQARQELRLLTRIEQANLLEIPEEEFNRLIIDIEKSPVFKRLCQQERIVRYHRFPRTDISPHFYELKEEAVAESGSFDAESLLSSKEDIVRLVTKVGLEKFKKYFLYPDLGVTVAEIAQECHLDVFEVQRINNLIDEFSIASEFYHPSSLSRVRELHYSKVASVENGPEGFVISYFSPAHARGKFQIDYEKFEKSCQKGAFDKAEVSEIRKLFRKLELINSRKDTLYRVLHAIVEKQALYLDSGNIKALLPFTQKELAERLELAPSSVCRAIFGKSVDTTWGEKPLKDFFPRPKRFRKELIRQFLETETEPLPDEVIKAKLETEFGVSISRRAVANLRKELKIPSSWERKKAFSQRNEIKIEYSKEG